MTTAAALRDTLISPNVPDSNMEPANVVDVIAGAGLNIARALNRLGNGDAATPMGGLEALGVAIRESSDRLAVALERVADAIAARP